MGVALFATALGITFATIDSHFESKIVDEYNGGICKTCGGHYEYLQAVGHLGETAYIYVCDGCHRSLELPRYYG